MTLSSRESCRATTTFHIRWTSTTKEWSPILNSCLTLASPSDGHTILSNIFAGRNMEKSPVSLTLDVQRWPTILRGIQQVILDIAVDARDRMVIMRLHWMTWDKVQLGCNILWLFIQKIGQMQRQTMQFRINYEIIISQSTWLFSRLTWCCCQRVNSCGVTKIVLNNISIDLTWYFRGNWNFMFAVEKFCFDIFFAFVFVFDLFTAESRYSGEVGNIVEILADCQYWRNLSTSTKYCKRLK